MAFVTQFASKSSLSPPTIAVQQRSIYLLKILFIFHYTLFRPVDKLRSFQPLTASYA